MDNGLALMIIGLLVFLASMSVGIHKQLLRVNTLLTVLAQRQPGHRRSGTILRLPHINYGDDESLIDEA